MNVTLASLMDLQGRRGLVTGAAGHLGRVIAHTLAELSCDMVLVDRPGSDYGGLAIELARFGIGVEVLDCDLEDEHQRDELVAALNLGERRLDVLVNNAAFVGTSGLTGWVAPFEEQTVSTWRRALEVNLTAAFHLSRDLAGALGRTGGGSIINIASTYAMYGPDQRLYEGTMMGNPAAYAASKGGLVQLTRWMATTLAPAVRVNAISPGGLFRNQPDVFVERYVARTPLGRMGAEDDLRGAVAYLATGLSGYVTGQNLVVDGGWGVW